MKSAILSVLILLAQNCPAQRTFQKNFGGDKFDRALFLSGTSDGGYILCGYSSSFSSSYDIYVVKLDAKGELQWQKNFGKDRTDVGWGILELKDKSFLLFGSIGIDSTNDDIYVARLSEKGEILWQRTYGNDKYERCTQMLATADGNFLLIGQRNVGPDNNIDSYVLKISQNGELIWEKCFGGPHAERTYYGGETPTGDLLISGSILPYAHNKADIFLLKLNGKGDMVWTKTIGTEDVHEIVHSFCINRDKKIYTLTGYSETSRAGYHEALFLQIDENGIVLNWKTNDTGEDIRPMHSEQTADGGFISTGYTRIDITKEHADVVLMKFDKDGIVTWLKTFGQPDKDDQGYWIMVHKDGGYSLAGYTHSRGINGDLWLIRTDASGEFK